MSSHYEKKLDLFGQYSCAFIVFGFLAQSKCPELRNVYISRYMLLHIH